MKKVSELEIPSPGFPPNHNLIKKAKKLQSEYDFYDAMPKSVWISEIQMVKPQPHKWLHIYFHMLEQ